MIMNQKILKRLASQGMDFEEFCDDEEFDIDVFNEMILEDYYVIRITYENNFEDDFDEY